MIKNLKISNVGPAPEMELDFGSRLNILTGDNGLGKSFILDVVWWSLTGRWPAEINPKLTTGRMAFPYGGKGNIRFSVAGTKEEVFVESSFNRRLQFWERERANGVKPELVVYTMADGSFAVWQPYKVKSEFRAGMLEEQPLRVFGFHYVFNPKEVWDGLQNEEGTWICNGLLRDWANWVREKGEAYEALKQVLVTLSPPDQKEKLEPGALTRIDFDARDMPTIKAMPWQEDYAVVHASSGIRRILTFAYILVWSWEEHKKDAKLNGSPVTDQISFLFDEVEAHLHPKWQRSIVPSLMRVMKHLSPEANVQLIATTHSPLVMASLEPHFDLEQDAWFDLDFEADSEKNSKEKQVVLRKRDFEKHGSAATWLISEAFDLKSTRSPEAELLIDEASALLDESKQPDPEAISAKYQELVAALSPKDDFLFRWRALCQMKGLLK